MRSRKAVRTELEPYWHNPEIAIVYELDWKDGEKITPGTVIKIKNNRLLYRFDRLVTNTRTGEEWVDCMCVSPNMNGFYSFYVKRITGPVQKRSRAKNARK